VVFRIRNSKKDRQHNGQRKNDKQRATEHTYKTKDRVYVTLTKRKGGKTRKSVNLSINSKDGIHPGRLLSLAITKHILLDTYTECFDIIQESEIVQIRVEQDELSSLF
jgi:AMMECR1 domain-containing protein